MRLHRWMLLVLTGFIVAVVGSGCGREDVTKYAPVETYPDDTLLQSIENKRALIVIAHDDDMCAMTGTVSILNKQGWKIRVLSFNRGHDRNAAHRRACTPILDSVLFFDIQLSELRNDTGTILYEAVPKAQFEHLFNQSLVSKQLKEQVRQFKPSVLFTLDNEIGGYGHPEHVFLSQLVLDLAESDSIPADYIYQSVYTDHMENTIMERHSKRMKSWGFDGDDWEKAKEAYQVSGMPEPTVQIKITKEAQNKMNYLKSYNERERKTMGFYIPAFEEYSAVEYFEIFDREFFRVTNLD